MANFEFSNYCSPAQLYLVLAMFSLVYGFVKNFQFVTLITKGIMIVIWAWILNWLCSKGFKTLSWLLVLFPFIVMLFAFFALTDILRKGGSVQHAPPAQQNK
jgi:hypothetical protein